MKLGWQQIRLTGVQQWVSLRGNSEGPILVFVHGGPGGAAEFGPRRRYLGALENDWMVADWGQRGAGRSFRGDETAATLSLDLLVDDAIALVELLHEQSHGHPVVIVGPPSKPWSGSPQAGVYASGTAGVQTQRRLLGSFGGVSADPKFLTRWVISIMTARDCPVRAKVRYQAGMSRSMDLIWLELGARIDFAGDVAHLPVPVYLLAGDLDRITDLDQARDWFEHLDAPAKHLEIVEGVGHLALYEAAPRFLALMAQVRADLTAATPE